MQHINCEHGDSNLDEQERPQHLLTTRLGLSLRRCSYNVQFIVAQTHSFVGAANTKNAEFT